MLNILRPLLELAVVMPGALLCLIPLRSRLRYSARRTFFIIASVLLLFCLGAAALCAFFSLRADIMIYPALPLFVFLYYRLTKQPLWRAASILLGVCCVFSVLGMLSVAADSLLRTENELPWICDIVPLE